MSVDIVFLNALGLLPPDIVATVRAGIEDGVAALRRHVPVEHIGVSVHDSTFVGEDTGFGGVSYQPPKKLTREGFACGGLSDSMG